MGTLTGRLVASKKSVKRFLSIILVWATLTCLQLTYLGSFDFFTSRWDEEREDESAVKEFNIASWHPKPLLACLSSFFYNTGLVFKNCGGRNCPPCQSWCLYEYDSKLPACSNVFLVCHEKLNRSPGLSAISTCSYPSWHSALRIPNVLFASVGRAPTRVARSIHLSMVVSTHMRQKVTPDIS